MNFNFDGKKSRSAHSSRDSSASLGKTVTSNVGGSGGGSGGGGGFGFPGSGTGRNLTSGGQYDVSRYNPVHDHLEIGSLIEDWMPRDASGLHQMWRLIYLRDAIVGPAIDLYSNLPYSECRLTGIDDPAILRVYQDTMERLDIVTMMPELVKEFLTIGKFCSSLIFDSRKGVFVDWTHHDPDFLRIEPIPVRGFDPKIDLVASPAMKNFLHSMDERDVAVRDQLPDEYFAQFEKQGTYQLNPLSTIFVPRRSSPYDYVGTSFLTRIVSFWALEKSLIESTVTNARRRTRSILHVTAGLENMWEPTEEELEAISGLFIQADEDPIGAVVTTRTGVETSEVRGGADFWKLSDEWAFLTEGKMRALGISDAFLCLAGDTYIPTVERGIVKIEDFLDKGRIPNFQSNTPYDGRSITVNSQYGHGTVDSWVYSGKKNVSKLITFSGYELEATKEHKIAILRDGEVLWTELDGVTKEDFVIVPVNECTRSKTLSLDRKISRNDISKIPSKNKVLFPKRMTPDLAFLLGSIVSEGCVDTYRTRFCNSSNSLVDSYVSKMKKVFGLDSFVYSKQAQGEITIAGIDTTSTKVCMDVNTNSKQLSAVLYELGVKASEEGLGKNNSYFKEVPWSILEADAQSQLSFLAAYLEGDGTVDFSKRTISFISYSDKIRKQLHIMLSTHGIVSNCRDKSVDVHGTFAIKLMEKLKPHLVDKYVKFDGVELNHNRYGLPAEQFVSKAEKKIIKITNSGVQFKTEGGGDIFIEGWVASLPPKIMHYDAYKRGEYDKWLSMLRRVDPNTYGQAMDLLEEEYFLDQVSLVEDTENYVDTYDLMMNSNCDRSFVASGILTHNSGDACVVGDTLVQTDRGLLEIAAIGEMGTNETQDRWGTWKDVKGLNVSSHNKQAQIVKWLDNGVKPVLRITDAVGNSIEATGNHPFLVLRDGVFEQVRADSLEIGDLLSSTTKAYTRSGVLELNLSNPSNVIHGGQRKVVTKPSTMTPDLAYLLGLLVSEGSILKKASQVRFSNSDPELLQQYENLVYKIFGLGTKLHPTAIPGKYNTCYDSVVCSKTLVEWLDELGCYTDGDKEGKSASHHKVVPWSVLQADSKSQIAFAAAFLEGDGNVNLSRKSISFISSSKKLLIQLKSLLASNGIPFGVIQSHGRGCHKLVLGSRDVSELVSKTEYTYRGFEKLRAALNIVEGKVSGFGVPSYAVEGYYNVSTRKKFNYAAVSYEDLENTDDNKIFSDNRYFFTPIESIEDVGEKNTYCLTLNDKSEHLFVGNSIMVSNTYNNMETALSVFMESLRTLRSYMDRRVFYEKIFATLARVHGFVKKDARKGPMSLRPTMDYKKAMKIPKEDLLIPKIAWDKKLQPEGDMNFLDMLKTADEAGVPVTLKQWSSAAGLNLEETMEELNEDSKYRKKIAEWRKQFTGDQAMEQEVMSGEGLKSIPVWDSQNDFVVLSSNEALDILEHFLGSRQNMLKLTSPGETMRTISSMVDGHAMKTELMAYLLKRLGVNTDLPIENRTIEAIGEHLYKIGTASDSPVVKKAIHSEFQILARVMSKDIPQERKLSLLKGMSNRQDMTPFSPKAVTGVDNNAS